MSSLPPASLACTICSEFYKSSDEVLATSCGHVFHNSCYHDWQTRSMTCPDCRLASPNTHRIFMHFEEHTEAERELVQSKSKLIAKVAELERQLSESEANFMNALEALNAKDVQINTLNNELEFRKAQNDSYEHELSNLKQKETSGGFGKDFYRALEELKITDMEKLRNCVDSAMDISPIAEVGAVVRLPSESTDTSSASDLVIADEGTKSIFASKFAPDTTEIEIENYLREKLPNLRDITVFKFPAPSFRKICSFRITVPISFYDIIVRRSFWPDFTLVREFVERPRVVTLTDSESPETNY